jgi:hypothetical protein
MPSSIEVADIFRRWGPAYREAHPGQLSIEQLRAMRAIEVCRTAVLGGHVEECDQCGAQRIAYNSCRNRHCPKCQWLDKEQWVEAQQALLLGVDYFHVVFTLPSQLHPLALGNPSVVYGLLFQAASASLQALSADPTYLGAQIGFTALLHTWSQRLDYHPHLHCIVTGGGLSAEGSRWISSRRDFFLPVRVLSRLFRGKLLAKLKKTYTQGELSFSGSTKAYEKRTAFQGLLTSLYEREWVVYCKPPFAGPEKMLEYLGRYSHRVALSNDRLIRFEADQVTFCYRDRMDHDQVKSLMLDAFEFIRRFLLHVLPHQFTKIRHYGILSTRNRSTKLRRCQHMLGCACAVSPPPESTCWQERMKRLTGIDPRICPHCGKGTMKVKKILDPLWKGACRSGCSPPLPGGSPIQVAVG